MKNLLIVTVLLLTLFSCSKPKSTPELLNSFCEDLSYSKLIKELKKQQKKDTVYEYNFGAWQERDIISNYRENLFGVSVSSKKKEKNHEIWYIKLITQDSSIVSYKIYNSIYDSEIRGRPVSNELLFFKQNKNEIGHLKNIFKEIYKTRLNFNELFRTDLFFGDWCGGIASRLTNEQIEINGLVKEKDFIGIKGWLQSSHTEKQLFGLSAIYQLQQIYIKIPDDILIMLKAIEGKSGSVSTCSGCTRQVGGRMIQEEIKSLRGY